MPAPASSSGLGPSRSAAGPLSAPRVKKRSEVRENTTEAAARPAPNSAEMGPKKAPKLKATPKRVNNAAKAAATTTQALTELRSGPET